MMVHHFTREWLTDSGSKREVRFRVELLLDECAVIAPFIPPDELLCKAMAQAAVDLFQWRWLTDGHDFVLVTAGPYKGIFRLEEWGRTTGINAEWYVVLSVNICAGPAPGEDVIDVDFEEVKPKRLSA